MSSSSPIETALENGDILPLIFDYAVMPSIPWVASLRLVSKRWKDAVDDPESSIWYDTGAVAKKMITIHDDDGEEDRRGGGIEWISTVVVRRRSPEVTIVCVDVCTVECRALYL